MKLTKENVYVDLQGKTKEELTDLWEFLISVGEKPYRNIEYFLNYQNELVIFLNKDIELGWGCFEKQNKQEVTIEQLKEILQPVKTISEIKLDDEKGVVVSVKSKPLLFDVESKEILQPMKTFTPIAMKCTQEQFEAIKPKLEIFNISGIERRFNTEYLTNWFGNEKQIDFTWVENKRDYNREVHEEWNEEVFLKACGIEVESLEQQLQKAEVEVKRLREAIEVSKIKDGDWCTFWNHDKSKSIIAKFQGSKFACITSGDYFLNCEKITDSVLLESLNRLFKH